MEVLKNVPMLYMAQLGSSVPDVTILLKADAAVSLGNLMLFFFVSKSFNIHSKPWKSVFVHSDCLEHSAITEKTLIGALSKKPSCR